MTDRCSECIDWLLHYFLQSIAVFLSPAQRLKARLVCRDWNQGFASSICSLTTGSQDPEHLKRLRVAFPSLRHICLEYSELHANTLYQLLSAAELTSIEVDSRSWLLKYDEPYSYPPVLKLENLALTIDRTCQHLIDSLPHLAQQLKTLVLHDVCNMRVSSSELDYRPIARLSKLTALHCNLPERPALLLNGLQRISHLSVSGPHPAAELLQCMTQLQDLRVFNSVSMRARHIYNHCCQWPLLTRPCMCLQQTDL